MDHSSQTYSRGAPKHFKALHYLIISAVVPTFAFDIPVAAIQHNPGSILGIIMVGVSAILSVYRSGLLKRAKSDGQSHEYQVLLPDQDILEQAISTVQAKIGQTEKTFFAMVDFVLASTLLVATVLLYVLHGNSYSRYYGYHEDSGMVVVKTWGSLPMTMVW